MILGIGSDLVDMRRIEKSIQKFGDRMTHRIYTSDERAYAQSRSQPTTVYATRFAAKEALVKALGTGIVSQGVSWQDIEVQKDPAGKPGISLKNKALEALQALVPKGMEAKIDLSLSDESPYAQAFVVLSAHSI